MKETIFELGLSFISQIFELLMVVYLNLRDTFYSVEKQLIFELLRLTYLIYFSEGLSPCCRQNTAWFISTAWSGGCERPGCSGGRAPPGDGDASKRSGSSGASGRGHPMLMAELYRKLISHPTIIFSFLESIELKKKLQCELKVWKQHISERIKN